MEDRGSPRAGNLMVILGSQGAASAPRQETHVADDPKVHSGRDRSRVDLSQPDEVAYWTERLEIDEVELRRAIADVGDQAQALHEHFGR